MIRIKIFLLLVSFSACLIPGHVLNAQSDESLILTFKGHKGPVYSLAVNPDGSTIATGSEDMLIHLWDPASGEIKKTLEGHAEFAAMQIARFGGGHPETTLPGIVG